MREGVMIARIWHGYTLASDANAYEDLLKPEPLPGLAGAKGYIGSYILRRPFAEETEFTVILLFDSVDAIRAIVGDDYERAIIPELRRRYLTRYDERSAHSEIVGVHGMGLAL